jgi:ferritin-like metal-binding protein YciE
MATNDGRKLLVKCLEDIYALESHLVQMLNDHAKDAQQEPTIRQKIEQHVRETELHRDRVEQRLNALGGSKPGFKATLSNVMGQVLGAAAGGRANPLAKNACDEYAAEQLEIASYVELITLAQTIGDVDTLRTAQLNLRDEVSMEQWLIQQIPEVTLKGAQQEGVQVPANALPSTQSVLADLGLGGFGVQPPPSGTFQQPPFGATQQPPPYQETTPQQTPPTIS